MNTAFKKSPSPAEVLRKVFEGTASTTGPDFFRALTRHLSHALGLRYCLITECLDWPPTRVRTLAFWSGDRPAEDYEFVLAETPCERVVLGEEYLVSRHIRELFPNDPDLANLDAESYAAVPMANADGRILGHLALFDVEPLDIATFDLPTIRILADRAGAELQRQRLEEERRLLQLRILETEKRESLGELASGLADDLNNILVGILGNAGLALDELDSASSCRDHLKDIEIAARRAAELARLMLAYSGKGHFVIENLHPGEFLEELRGELEKDLPSTAELAIEIAPEIPTIAADRHQLRQAIASLVANAAEAIEGCGSRGGRITVELGRCEVGDGARVSFLESTENALAPGEYAFLSVQDDGCGMDELTLARVFDPFFTTKLHGRGLGLAAVHGIIRGHRGSINIESQPGGGTRVRILLPAVEV